MKEYNKNTTNAEIFTDFMACSFRDEGCGDLVYPDEHRLHQINAQVKRQAHALWREEEKGKKEKRQVGN